MNRNMPWMILFGIFFVIIASSATFGAVWVLGHASGGGYASLD